MAKKKKKKIIAKRRTQAKAKKTKKSKKKSLQITKNVQQLVNEPISEIHPPEGFRAVSVTQGMLEFISPLMEYVENGTVKNINDAMQLGMLMWNFGIMQPTTKDSIRKKDIVRQVKELLKFDEKKASEFTNMMLERKTYLFPEDIQPNTPTLMFIRKEGSHAIEKFNYDSLELSDEKYIPGEEDKKLVHALNKMDEYIANDNDYMEWEAYYLDLEKKCIAKFEDWLSTKGLQNNDINFADKIEPYLNFIYRYIHEEKTYLKNVKLRYIEEFFVDYLLRKVIAEPEWYIHYPPALKLFYQFLSEIGYIEKPQGVIKLIDLIEPYFIELLKERYA